MAEPDRQKAWISAAILCAALLILPAVAWLLAPRAGGFSLPPADGAPERTTAQAIDDQPPEPVRAITYPKPRAAESAHATDAPVKGTVLDPDGKPVQGAFVGCDDRDRGLTTTTDASGRFTLPPEASGCLAVSHHPDYMPAERAQLSAGRDNTLRLGRGGSIEGDVVDERNSPIASYMIGVESFLGTGEAAEGIPPTGTVKTINDPKGAFRFENLPPGKYVLTASAEGRPPARSRSVDVEVSRATRHVRITLPRGALLHGKVIDADTRKPVAGATISLDTATSTSANAIAPVRTDDAGAYSLDGAPPGPFSIRVAHELYRTKIVSGLTTRGAAQLTQDVEIQLRGDAGPADEFAGIGAVLAPAPAGVMVATVIPSGPAQGAGVRVGDILLKIDGLDVAGVPMPDCVQRLRGPDGTIVSVSVKHLDGSTAEINITRRAFVR